MWHFICCFVCIHPKMCKEKEKRLTISARCDRIYSINKY